MAAEKMAAAKMPAAKMPAASYPTFLASLMDSRLYSDLTLVCHGQEHHVHKNIVCMQSPVIAAALHVGFKEAETNRINVSFDDATCRRMIEFMYTGDYHYQADDNTDTAEEQKEGFIQGAPCIITFRGSTERVTKDEPCQDLKQAEALSHIRVSAIGDYYNVPGLCHLASAKFQQTFKSDWSANSFAGLIDEAPSDMVDKSMHEAMGSVVAQHLEELVNHDTFNDLELPKALMHSILNGCAQRLRTADVKILSLEATINFKKVNGGRY
ncbi:hypothetical protein GGR56DRAFT_660194 [Xylariaceae sp. FL0804]|nr:hypothetical protein GGR56DRAFT_660194 [Xylariaceae sp. FL0804]